MFDLQCHLWLVPTSDASGPADSHAEVGADMYHVVGVTSSFLEGGIPHHGLLVFNWVTVCRDDIKLLFWLLGFLVCPQVLL